MHKLRHKDDCNICLSREFTPVLDLGEMPVSNAFLRQLSDAQNEEKFPLAVQLCENCMSLQLMHIVPSELIFRNYHYATGASRPLAEHFFTLGHEIAEQHIQSSNDLVVEIGSNDGSLLGTIKHKANVLGIDPAQNIAEIAIKNGIPTIVDFFTSQLAKKIRRQNGQAKIMVANNVMAHAEDLRDIFIGVKSLLSENGKFIFEVHWVGNLLTEGGFDQIYHEHIYYHSLHSLKVLLDSLGFIILDIITVPIHGESMRVYAGLDGEPSERVLAFFERERRMGLNKRDAYMGFSAKVEKTKNILNKVLSDIKSIGKKIIGYGAPAKGNTLLNYFKIGPETIEYITDTTPQKQGMYTPGTHIPIVHPSILERETPDYVLLLSWNYAEAILEKEKKLRQRGAKFIIPVPEVLVV